MALIFKGYLKETRRPAYSAALLAPFFCIYHAGTVALHTTYINGADALIVRILSSFSVNSMFASALILLACFAIWQWRSRASWKIDSAKLFILFVESLCFALILLFLFGWIAPRLSAASAQAGPGVIANLVLYCGAGIYEELVFRGFLLGFLIIVFSSAFKMKRPGAAIAATIAGALLFSLFHYIGAAGDVFTFNSFMQRTIGGLYFSILFVTRGFGVTAASHALYDILVGLILA
jgi:membrane protease YdiL (CAAX protease family)